MHFGKQVRKERLARGLALTEFAQRIGFDPGHLSRIENGTRPPTLALATACDTAFPETARLVHRVLRGTERLV
jgi:transcriptional regulator with XRE-family HTH domain